MQANALSRRGAWALTLAATFTMTISYVDRQTLSFLAPTVTRELKFSDSEYGLLASAFSLAYLLGSPVAGRWIDRVGARRGLVAAVLVWTAVAALHAVVPGYRALLGCRILLGVAESPSFPGAAQTVQRALPPAERARGFGILFTGSSLGAMIAPWLATLLLARFPWRFAFVGTALAGLVWLPVWLLVTSPPAARDALDAAPDPRAETPLSAISLATHPAVLRAAAVVVASSPVIGFVLLWSSKFLDREYGIGQKELGQYVWLPPLLFDIGAVAFGDLAARRARDGDRLLVAVAAALTALVALIPLAPREGGAWGAMAIASLALAGGGGLFALATADILAPVPAGSVSAAGGVTAAAQSLAYIASSLLIGWSVDRTHSYRASLLALGGWVLPGCLVWLFVPPPRRAAR